MSQRLEALGLTPAIADEFAQRDDVDGSAMIGRVARVDRGESLVLTADDDVRVFSDAQRSQGRVAPVTGDWVVVVDDDEAGFFIDHVFERTTAMVRRDPAEQTTDQVLASNIDRVAVVHGLDQAANDARIERFLVVAFDSGAEPLIVLNKSDIAASDASAYEWLRSVGPVITTSAIDGVGIDELRRFVPFGTTLAFIGPSGVGKSALVNALAGGEVAETGEVRSADRRGRHTTTTRELIELPHGGVLIDTPGIRAVGLWAADIALDQVFADIADLAAACRFRDCTHRSEPGCAVVAAVADRTIDPERLARYHQLWQELAEQTIELERQKGTARRGRRG